MDLDRDSCSSDMYQDRDVAEICVSFDTYSKTETLKGNSFGLNKVQVELNQ